MLSALNIMSSHVLRSLLYSAALTLVAGAAASHARLPASAEAAQAIDNAPLGDPNSLAKAIGRVTDGAQRALLRARIAALESNAKAASRALRDYFALGDRDPRRRSIALTTRADVAFAQGDYSDAAAALDDWRANPDVEHRPEEVEANEQTSAIAHLLAGQPRQVVEGGTPIRLPTVRDAVGLVRAGVLLNGIKQDAVLDTGANLSVVSSSAARRLGLRLLDGTTSVGSASSKAVATRLAVADRLVIAGVTLSHVAFLVMDDAQLTFPVEGGYRIDVIVGYPVFHALGRVRFEKAGWFSAGAAACQVPNLHNLRLSGNDLYVLARVQGARVALHLDTGATSSNLTGLFAGAHPELAGVSGENLSHVIGAGGAVLTERNGTLKNARILIGGQSLTLAALSVSTASSDGQAKHRMGVVGQDVLQAFDSYAIDFGSMTFAVGKRR